MRKQLLFLLFSCLSLTLQASIRLPNILSSNMVLQQQSKAKVWGWSAANETIKITSSWDNKTTEVTADGNARWQAELQTPKAGGPYTISFEGENKIVLENVLIGEVWVASGQSNMEWSYDAGVESIREEFDELASLNIRLFNMPKVTSESPQDNSMGSWSVCDSTAVKSFSAVAYYFAKHLNEDLNVPIGLIGSNWGGTPAEAWTPSELVQENVVLSDASSKLSPQKWWPVRPGSAYNAMIAPVLNYAIAGTIWYQGESNVVAPGSYAQLMGTMIQAWREAWGQQFPFYFVQIAPFAYANHSVGAWIREAQTKTLSVPKTGMVVVSDLVEDTSDIHPLNKKDVGLRLANMALTQTYGLEKGAYKSPLYKSLRIEANRAIIDFNDAEQGLILKGDRPQELFIAGADRVFHPATLEIMGSKLAVWSKEVKIPVAVRYEFSNAGIGNIASKGGLPLAPFRTDEWELDTSEVK